MGARNFLVPAGERREDPSCGKYFSRDDIAGSGRIVKTNPGLVAGRQVRELLPKRIGTRGRFGQLPGFTHTFVVPLNGAALNPGNNLGARITYATPALESVEPRSFDELG